VLVAESEQGQVIGIVALVPACSPRGAVARVGEAELSRLAIATAARGQVEAHSLYESLGFRRTPERDGLDPDGRRWVFSLGPEAKR
jgi:ribosomal protein S18 acetylase RimI-like enzyme